MSSTTCWSAELRPEEQINPRTKGLDVSGGQQAQLETTVGRIAKQGNTVIFFFLKKDPADSVGPTEHSSACWAIAALLLLA